MKVLTVTQGELIAIAVHYAVSIALEVVRPFLSREIVVATIAAKASTYPWYWPRAGIGWR